MAEFKLGRIRFVWKGDWTPNTTYYVDDVVKNGGRTFICVSGHKSDSDFYTDLDYSPARWNQMTDGQEWRNEWTTSTYYKENDLVKYGGLLYICKNSHTSAATNTLGLEANILDWEQYGEGFDWKGDWSVSTRYKKNDLIKYGGKTYVCNTEHTSAGTPSDGLELDQSKWDSFNQGIEYRGPWATITRYKANDVVQYGGSLWICTTHHTSAGTFGPDEAKWSLFVKGFEFNEDWNIATTYQPGDIVRYGGNQYIAKTNHIGETPSTSSANWSLFTEGFNWASSWNIGTSYKIGDVVKVNGNTYIAIADSPSATLTITSTTAATDYFTTDTSTSGLLPGMTVKFTGTTFGNVFTGGTYYVRNIPNTTNFTISTVPSGSLFQAATATGTMTATFGFHPNNRTDKWQLLTSGINWAGIWSDDTEYELGDAVRYNSNAYICIQKHRSEGDDGSSITAAGGGAANSRPDKDVVGAYWNILTIGSETSILTTRGDLAYYSGSGPARLPVGLEGQVLQAGAIDPEWVTLGKTDHVYYVAPHGQDLPAPIWGLSQDKPWKSIRYACEQVEKGSRNVNAQFLLEMNRVFVQKEVTEWIQYQIQNSIAPFTTEFVYDEFKCERDIGFIIDRLIHDLGHGGNLKIRAAAQTYLNALSDGPFSTNEDQNGTGTYNNLVAEADKDVAAFEYMLTVVESVLNNQAPSTSYQAINSDNSTAVVEQFFDNTKVAEPTAYSEIENLVSILTTALSTQDPNSIPARYSPSNLINVATGRYRETLPIIVPAYTCVLGDELRSTNAGPAGRLIDPSDSYYSISTLSHIESVVSDIVVGNTVTPTSAGPRPNLETQSDAFPFADIPQADQVSKLINVMKHNVDYKLNTMHLASLTDPVGYNSSYLVGYGYARKLLKENKQFLQEEVIAYLADNYPTSKYGKTKTRRDVGYIIDALIYDLTYSGNALSVKAGLAYWDGDDNTQPQIPASIKALTLDCLAYLKIIAQTVSTEGAYTPLQTSVPRYRDTAGSAGASTLIGNNIDAIIEIINNGPDAVGSTVTLTDPTPANGVNTTTALISAYNTLNATVPTIQTAVVDYINSTYGNFTYNSEYCRRDSGYLVDAAYYDSAFGSNYWAVQNGISYFRRQASAVTSQQLAQEIGAVNYIKGRVATIMASNSTAVTRSNATYTEIVDILQNGVSNADVLTFTDTGTANFTNARTQLQTNRAFIISEISTWLNTNYNALWTSLGAEGQATCQRDVGYMVDALSYDVNYGGNLATINHARSLFNNITGVSVYPTAQKAASAAMYTQLGSICSDIVQELYAGQNTSGTAASATEGARMVTLCGNVESVITADSLSGLVAASTPSISWVAAGIQTAVGALSSAKADIIVDTLQFITDTYSNLVYSHAKAERDAAIVLKAVGYDFMFNSNYQSLKAAHAYLRETALELFDQSTAIKQSTLGALEFVRSQAVANVGGDSTAIARINALMDDVYNIVYGGSYQGDVCQSESRNVDYAILQLERNRDFIVAEIDAYIANTFRDTATATNSSGNIITISDTSWLKRNSAIKFTGTTFGNIVAETTYYVQKVLSSTTFTIALTRNATDSEVFVLSSSSGSMGVEFVYNRALCLRDAETYVDALKWDLRYTSNYKSKYVARYYINAVTGSYEEDMYYLRDGTGIRDQTLEGLTGDLTPENEFGTSRVTSGAFCSLDPGWGPADFRTWILTRSPYVQGVTTFGNAAIGQKIDGALHNGGNDSMVSNDFTQVISDGIGAWVTNNGRAELVSVFTYYSHIGYLSENGGRIRGTNGNNSYGDFGSVAEGFDNRETPNSAIIDNRFQFKATISNVATDGDEILWFEFENAGNDYTDVNYVITGGGAGAITENDEFRDNGVFQVRLLDQYDGSTLQPTGDGEFGGEGYITNSNTAQGGTLTSITIAATDSESSTAYIGMRIVLTGGAGVGQTAIIDTYNSGTKIATVIKESDSSAGWDHYIPGRTIQQPDASTTYTIEPRLVFTSPGFTSAARTLSSSNAWSDVLYSPIIKSYTNIAASGGLGADAKFFVHRRGTKYILRLESGGENYQRMDTLTISGNILDGVSPENDVVITVTSVNGVTGEIKAFDYEGVGAGGNFVAIADSTAVTSISRNGTDWVAGGSMPSSTTWKAMAAGKITTVTNAGSFVTGKSYTISSSGNTNFQVIGAPDNLVGTIFIATGPGTVGSTGTAIENNSVLVAIENSGTATAYSNDSGNTWTAGGALPASGSWTSIAYGAGAWVAVRSGSTDCAISVNGGISWTAGTALPASRSWTSIAYGAGKWVVVASGTDQGAISDDNGATWTAITLSENTNWSSVTFGNNRFVAVSSSSGTVASYSLDGINWVDSTLPTASYTNVRYGQGLFLAVSQSTQAATSEDGIYWTPRTMSTAANGFSSAAFGNPTQAGIWAAVQRGDAGTVASSVLTGAKAKARALVAEEKIYSIVIIEPGSGYTTPPTMTIVDPNNVFEAPFEVRVGKGALANPNYISRGSQYSTGSASVDKGDGYGNFYQTGSFVAVRQITREPIPGSNIVFGHLPDRTFKLVNVITFLGQYDGSYTAFFQISPPFGISEAPNDGETLETRIRYSQVRLTGHDFLDIGTGSFADTNYPGTPSQDPIPANETLESNGGRVFYTSTDQDGNFRVGDLFTIEQSTGIATLNADAFNISGLQELNLGNVTLGGGSATVTEFSTDPFFTADSDNIVPTQRAIKAYIAAQIGGGGASLNVNSVTAGSILINGNQITNITGAAIKMNATFEFRGGVTGLPLAFNYFLT